MKKLILFLAFIIILITTFAQQIKSGIFTFTIAPDKNLHECYLIDADITQLTGHISIPNYIINNDTQYYVSAIVDKSIGVGNKITEIDFPDHLRVIDNNGIYLSSALTILEFPNSLQYIGSKNFYACNKLTEIHFGTSPLQISENSFMYGKALKEIYFTDSVYFIGANSFSYCPVLDTIMLPSLLVHFEARAFSNCPFVYFIIDQKNENFTTENGILFNKEKSLLIKAGGMNENISIPEGVIKIEDKALSHSYFSKISIPSTVKIIGNHAFEYNKNLKSIEFSNNLKGIGNLAFSMCKSLKKIDLPASTEFIGIGAFSSCESLKRVICRATTPPEIKEDVFPAKTTIYVPAESLELYQKHSGWSVYTIKVLKK